LQPLDQRRWRSFASHLAHWTKRLTGHRYTTPQRARCRPYTVVLDMRSDQGCHRPDNEDSIRYVYPERPGRQADRGILALVADGMGGHAAGDVASAMAVRLIVRAYYRHRSEPHKALKQAFLEANRVIYSVAQQQVDYRGMGTTCTGLVLRGGVAYAAHVGDSRLYLVRHGAIYLMTEDHSVAMHMMRQGLINPDEAWRHRARTVLLRALGTRSQPGR
jgi:PPM family protein phosphatase